jgi:hypothetical protein
MAQQGSYYLGHRSRSSGGGARPFLLFLTTSTTSSRNKENSVSIGPLEVVRLKRVYSVEIGSPLCSGSSALSVEPHLVEVIPLINKVPIHSFFDVERLKILIHDSNCSGLNCNVCIRSQTSSRHGEASTWSRKGFNSVFNTFLISSRVAPRRAILGHYQDSSTCFSDTVGHGAKRLSCKLPCLLLRKSPSQGDKQSGIRAEDSLPWCYTHCEHVLCTKNFSVEW